MSETTENNPFINLIKVKTFYKAALFCYVFPFLFIGLQIIDSTFLHATDGLFFVMFLICLLPFLIAGGICNVLGVRLSRKNNLELKNTGYTNLIIGSIILIGSVSGLAFFFYKAF